MDVLFANNAKTLLNGAILIDATSIVVDDGTNFPSPTGGQFFYCTLQNPADDTDYEIVKCTARSTNTLTVTREQEGTSAQAWADGTLCELRLTSGGIDELKDHEADHLSGGSAEIDGDKLDIDWDPSNYSPDSDPVEVSSVDHLTAHLKGIDTRLAQATQDARGTLELATHVEAQTGSETGMAVSPSALTAVLKQQSWIQEDGYYIGTDQIRARDGDGLLLTDDGNNGIFVEDGGNVAIGNITPLAKLSIGSYDDLNQVYITHDTYNAWIKTDGGGFNFATDEGGDDDTYVSVRGTGNGIGYLRCFDEAGLQRLEMRCEGATAYISIAGTSPVALSLQEAAEVPVRLFESATEGETVELEIYGYKTGDALRTLAIGVGVDEADTASFDGLSNYYFNGNVGINCTIPAAQLHVDQGSTSGAKPVLSLDQADISEEFIRFIGSAADGVLTQSIVDEGDQGGETREGWLKVYVQDDGNQITDQAYFIPIYSLSL